MVVAFKNKIVASILSLSICDEWSVHTKCDINVFI